MGSINLKNALGDILTDYERSVLARGYDKIGDIAVVVVPEALEQKEVRIAETLLANIKGLRAVAKRVGTYSGEFRIISLKLLAGKGGLETVHREYGISLCLDPEKVYFSPRSGSERYRVARKVTPGEKVLIMFSGVAPLPLMISRYSEASEIHAIEKNPSAHFYALKNIKVNRWANNITLHQGDVVEVLQGKLGSFDRIALVLPAGAFNFLPHALRSLAMGGTLHYYDFQHKGEFYKAENAVSDQCVLQKRKVMSLDVHKCGHISPGKYRICVDVQVE